MFSKPTMETLSLSDDCEPNSGAALFYAAADGHTRMVKEIITKNQSAIKYRNSEKQTPLHIAAYRGHIDAVIALVTANAALEAKDDAGDTPLICAVAGDKPDVAKYLMGRGSDVNASNNNGSTPLHFGAGKGYLRCVKVLAGEDEEIESEGSGSSSSSPSIDVMLSKPTMETLSLSDDFEPDSGAALFYAAAYGHTRKVEEIITNNRSAVKYRNSEKQTPLHIAAYRGHMNAVIALVSANAPLEAKDDAGDTPLICAVAGDKPDVAKYLMKSGSDVNASNNHGNTPLHFGAGKGYLRCVKVLVGKDEEKRCIVL